jgi:hypothetical protein
MPGNNNNKVARKPAKQYDAEEFTFRGETTTMAGNEIKLALDVGHSVKRAMNAAVNKHANKEDAERHSRIMADALKHGIDVMRETALAKHGSAQVKAAPTKKLAFLQA